MNIPQKWNFVVIFLQNSIKIKSNLKLLENDVKLIRKIKGKYDKKSPSRMPGEKLVGS